MTSNPHTSAQPATPATSVTPVTPVTSVTPATSATSVTETEALARITTVLADLLRVRPDEIDPELPLQAVGFDSMLGVALVAGLDERYGLGLSLAELSERQTLSSLARRMTGRHTPRQVGPDADHLPVLQVLRRQIAGLLHQASQDVDAEAGFAVLGLDSVLAAEFVAGINRTYGLSERPTVLHDHPSLAALTAHIASRTPQVARAPRNEKTVDLDALLDAVRDEALTVDEAVALLASRA